MLYLTLINVIHFFVISYHPCLFFHLLRLKPSQQIDYVCFFPGADSQTKLSSNMCSLSDKTNGFLGKLEDKTSSSDMQALSLDIENSFSNLILEAQSSRIVKDIHKPEDKPSSSYPTD